MDSIEWIIDDIIPDCSCNLDFHFNRTSLFVFVSRQSQRNEIGESLSSASVFVRWLVTSVSYHSVFLICNTMYVGLYFNVLIKLLKEYSLVINFWNENYRPSEFYLEIAGVYFLLQSLKRLQIKSSQKFWFMYESSAVLNPFMLRTQTVNRLEF